MSRLPAPVQRLRRELIRVQTKAFLLRQRHFGKVAFIHINKCGGTSVEKALGLPLIHDTALQRIDKIGRTSWDRMMTFALVRNPYAKAVSHYKYRTKTGEGGLDDGHIDLDSWIQKAYGEKDPRYHNNPLMFQPCIDWVADTDGTLLVKRILKLEEIATDWPAFCQEAFGKVVPLPHSNATGSGSSHPADKLNPTSREILRQHFARDFEAFGYAP